MYLLRYRCCGEFADEGVEVGGLLILGLVAAFVEDTDINAAIDTFKGFTSLGGSESTFASEDDFYGHL